MEEQNFNPLIETVVTIRHLAMAISNNWSAMKDLGKDIANGLEQAQKEIDEYASSGTNENWNLEMNKYNINLGHLKLILGATIKKIKSKDSQEISSEWDNYPVYADSIKSSLKTLYNIGKSILPENKTQEWETNWNDIYQSHNKIEQEAKSCSIQLKMIEAYSPKEIDDLTHTILKHIPVNYSHEDAQQYSEEYMKAYQEIKAEASKKKNLWDKFLDILAGGVEQTPAQRVMMKRWVDGEKQDLH